MNYLKEIIIKNRILICLYLSIGILITFLKNFSADYFQTLIDKFNYELMTLKIIMIYGIVLIILCILNYLEEYPGQKLKHGIFLDFKLKALKKIKKIDYKEYQNIGTGKLIQKIENGGMAGKDILVDFYFCVVRELIPSIIFSMVFIYKINKTIMLAILFSYVFVFIITNLLLKVLYKIKENILFNEEKMNHFLIRGFMEMVTFRINKRFKYEIEKAALAKKEIVISKVKMTMIHEAFFTIFELMVILMKIGIIGYGYKTKSISIGSIIALIALIDNAYTPIAIFNVLFVQYKLDLLAFNRYLDFLNFANDNELEEGMEIQNLNGNIAIDNLSFYYENRMIIDKMSLKINSGEKLAIVGESGSGKSTLVKLILGLLKPSKGKILIDDLDLSNIKLESYYNFISYISQEAPIFNGTLRENIVFDKKIEEKEIIQALGMVHLSELYSKLKDGLNTEVGERGVTLSGGERQRLAFARLWFEASNIVVIDEATSAIDNITEEKVMNNVLEYLRGKTIIAIAHRLNSIKNYDHIIAIKDGKIAGEGSFEELISNNSYFKQIYYENK